MSRHQEIFSSVLVIGAGPVGLVLYTVLAQGWAKNISVKTRSGRSLNRLRKNFSSNKGTVESRTSLANYPMLNAKTKLNTGELLLGHVQDEWETIFLCTPCTEYLSLGKLLSGLQKVKHIILISPEFGSADLLKQTLNSQSIEIISLSNYFGASLVSENEPGIINTLGVKKHVYLGGSKGIAGEGYKAMAFFLEAINIEVIPCKSEKEAESKNITSFVHLPFIFNDFSLREVFSRQSSKKSIYKLYPEGPITMRVISNMLVLHQEISLLYQKVQVPVFNILAFLNANYPVPEETISQKDISSFPKFTLEKQCYLLYVRYATLLIDPFSQPDKEGRYIEFSKFPYQQVYKFNNLWYIPRIPLEDYKKLELLYALSKIYATKNTVMQEMLVAYKRAYGQFIQTIGLENLQADCQLGSRKKEAKYIWQENKSTC